MKKKRLYMKPEAEAIQVNATAILAGSDLQANPANENYGATDETYKSDWN